MLNKCAFFIWNLVLMNHEKRKGVTEVVRDVKITVTVMSDDNTEAHATPHSK
jgi:hypothetical protein